MNLKLASLGFALSLLSACATQPLATGSAPSTGTEALEAYYNSLSASRLPVGPELIQLDEAKAVTRLILASCHDEEREDPALMRIASERADALLFVGDNVYGDVDGRQYMSFDIELSELAEAYAELGASSEYRAVAAKMPILPTWDDHDFGLNDAGRDFPSRRLAERMFESFYGLNGTEVSERPGVYYSRTAGPEGQRVQIIMLDTRFFRSELTRTDEHGGAGKERYIQSSAPDQDVLGDAQWAWLEDELNQPADVRLIVSSIQIIPDVHGWESWHKLPAERERLYELIKSTKAEGVVFLSGDRHTAYLYKDEVNGDYPLYELTSSSLNRAFASDAVSKEKDPDFQIGNGYAFTNYGEIEIDWEDEEIALIINDEKGEEVHGVRIPFAEIKAGRH